MKDVRDFFYYVSLLESLQALLSSENVRDQV